MSNNLPAGANPWFVPLNPDAKADVRLFCFPYAGGSSSIYRNWPKLLPPNVEVWVAKLPGRDNRLREAPHTGLATLTAECAQAIVAHLDRPFVFFGHSMGALLSYELSRLLLGTRGVQPAHLIVSARSAPQLPDTGPKTYDLPDAEFIEEVRRLAGTPREVLDHAELMQLILPLLRADFSVCQTYTHAPEPVLGCPLTILGGIQDTDITREKLDAWREVTRGTFSLRILPGDHFFINTAQPLVLRIVAQELLKISQTR